MMNRQELILDSLERRGACGYQELAEVLGVSAMTVRREVDRLAAQGLLIKTLGGAQKPSAPACYYETDLLSRVALHVPEKRAIAARALELIAPGQTVFLDPSTTCLEMAGLIAKRSQNLTIVTNSVPACLALGRGGRNTIVGIGGQYHAASGAFVGAESEESAGRYFVDRAFLSTKAFRPAEGTFESVLETIRVKQVVAGRCSELVLLVDGSKFGLRALSKALDISQIQTVITDAGAPKADLKRLERAGKHVLVAEAAPARPEAAHAP
ncbi:MAG: DeoR/GlpR family DNA-binding transcription regulator [Isosphaeraceae bacterium]|nr:DeoR/GlpR family DNA-binding transcription regulator [Isosphaeraceae bacterium]